MELLRAFNRRTRHRVNGADYYRFVKAGAVRRLVETRVPPVDEAGVTTPAWAIRRAREFSEADVQQIRHLGVTIVGDLRSLVPTSPVLAGSSVKKVRAVDTGLAATFSAHLLDASVEVVSNAETASPQRTALARVRHELALMRQRFPPESNRL